MDESANDAVVSVSKKIINTPEHAAKGELVLFVSEEAAEAWTAAESATRSGIDALDAVAIELGAESVEPVFNMHINGDEKRKYDLHRWFVVKFNEESDLVATAEKFAAIKEVNHVQYSTMLQRPNVRAVPAAEMPSTRVEEVKMPFNDPKLELQWHYHNQGLKAIYPTSREGEDINAFAAWNYTKGNNQIIVAVVDEGVKYNHPDLKDNMWVNEKELNGVEGKDDDGNGVVDDIHGINAVKGTGNITWDRGDWVTIEGVRTWDGDVGHGTHVAGTVAAVNNNGIGVAGVAGGSGNGDGVRIMSIQIFDGVDRTSPAANAKGIEYAADNGASILQNSWGYSAGTNMTDAAYESAYGIELRALRYFVNKSNCPAMSGSVAIFAAGNDTQESADYPGAYNEFLCVTAYSPDGLPTSYTNYKTGCNVAAPGGDLFVANGEYQYEGGVLSTLPTETIDSYTGAPYGEDYGYMNGTSMACPHVSGVAALVLSYAVENGITLTNKQLYDILASSVRNIDDQLTGSKPIYPGFEKYGNMNLNPYKGNMGTGKLDALMAIMSVRGAKCVPVTVGKELVLDVASLVGNGDIAVKAYNGYEISEDTKKRLGIDKVEFFSKSIYLTCKKSGIGVLTVKYIAGGDTVGGGDIVGGKLMEKDVVLVARDANDNGGWL